MFKKMIAGVFAGLAGFTSAYAVLPTVGNVSDIAGNTYNVESILSSGYTILVLKENTW